MEKTRLGKTELMVTKTAFGALPIQRISFDDAEKLLKRAYESGINFFDTARGYTDSEEKIGRALSDVRKDIIIATKSPAKTKEGVLEDARTSLKMLKTDYVDILQLHNPSPLPDPNNPDSSYAGLLEAKKRGYCRHIGITQHKVMQAADAVKSGLYETMQFPFSSISGDADRELLKLCRETDTGFIAMKGLAGGLIKAIKANFAYIRQTGAVPIYGVQRMEELGEFIKYENEKPALDDSLLLELDRERASLQGNFCRGCGYCQPCPQNINIPTVARMSLLLRRSPYQRLLSNQSKAEMERINECLECGLCRSRCPYELNIPELIRANLEDYLEFYKEHAQEKYNV